MVEWTCKINQQINQVFGSVKYVKATHYLVEYLYQNIWILENVCKKWGSLKLYS